MKNKNIHIVFLDPSFAERHYEWLNNFVFRSQEKQVYSFPCTTYSFELPGFVQFSLALSKANKDMQDILLPAHAIAGIRLQENRKNQLGFLDSMGCCEK